MQRNYLPKERIIWLFHKKTLQKKGFIQFFPFLHKKVQPFHCIYLCDGTQICLTAKIKFASFLLPFSSVCVEVDISISIIIIVLSSYAF